MSAVCARRKKPFVAWQKHDKHNPTATWRGERCPDCGPNKGGTPDVTLDCQEYMRARRLGARLLDGFRMLGGHLA